MTNVKQILDIGCGNKKFPGSVGIDMNASTQADIIHNLDQFPWPIEDNAFDEMVCNHVIEHVADMVAFMEEVHRIGRPGATISFVTPHFTNRSSYTDPTHVRHLAMRSWDYFCEKREVTHTFLTRVFETQYAVPDFYVTPHFRIVAQRLSFSRPYRITGLDRLFNRFRDFYEFYLPFIFPARDIYITLEVLK